MSRLATLSLAILFVVLCFSVRPAAADMVSRDNPYRSFNVSGVNYGSMQWERAHRGKAATTKRGTTIFRRR